MRRRDFLKFLSFLPITLGLVPNAKLDDLEKSISKFKEIHPNNSTTGMILSGMSSSGYYYDIETELSRDFSKKLASDIDRDLIYRMNTL
jgi:hypothetical protein